MTTPELSICIPTYNRAESLELSLASIVSQREFVDSENVEIVVGDNCSTDSTAKILARYRDEYGSKFSYFRNPVNVSDLNFTKVLEYARGTYLKLCSDTMIWNVGSVGAVLNRIRVNETSRAHLFFSNGQINSWARHFSTLTMEAFVGRVSFLTTWVACFGVWRSDLEKLENPNRGVPLKLVQTDILLRLICLRPRAEICNSRLFSIQEVGTKGGYNLFEVFVRNYLSLLSEYRSKGRLSQLLFELEKGRLFFRFLLPWVVAVRTESRFTFRVDGWLRYSRGNYWSLFRVLLFPLAELIAILRHARRGASSMVSVLGFGAND